MSRPLALLALLLSGCSDPESDHLEVGARAVLRSDAVACVREGGPGSVSGCREVPLAGGTSVVIDDDEARDDAGRIPGRRRLVRVRVAGGDRAGLRCEVARWELRATR